MKLLKEIILKHYNARIVAFVVAFLVTFLFATLTRAEESPTTDTSIAKKYGITFPIADLNNCSSLAECKSYCADSINKDACINYAKKKKFYKNEDKLKSDFISAAKTELGCESEKACKEFCGEQENWQKCGEFAKRHNKGKKDKSLKIKTSTESAIIQYKNYYEKFCKDNLEKCQDLLKKVAPTVSSNSAGIKEAYCKLYPDRCNPKSVDFQSRCQELIAKFSKNIKEMNEEQAIFFQSNCLAKTKTSTTSSEVKGVTTTIIDQVRNWLKI